MKYISFASYAAQEIPLPFRRFPQKKIGLRKWKKLFIFAFSKLTLMIWHVVFKKEHVNQIIPQNMFSLSVICKH